MLKIPDNVRQDLTRLVPSSIINDISCFVYYDHHPRDINSIDITICTKAGEVKEFYQRELVNEIYLECAKNPSGIKIMRNSECKLFYLVTSGEYIIVLSRKEKLYVHRVVGCVDKYEIDDSLCQGQACLKILQKDDAVPFIFDDKFESLGEKAFLLSSIHVDETTPVLMDLKRKLTEAKYGVKCNENTYNKYHNLRQLAAFYMNRKIHPNLDESVFKSGTKEMAGALKIKTQSPWVKLCNKKVIIVLNVINENSGPLEDVHMLLHVKNRPSLVYTTRLFEKSSRSPYWKEKCNQTIEDVEVAITAVVDLKELKENVVSRVDFSGVMVYQRNGKEFLLPFDSVSLSALDTMGEDFDALSSGNLDERQTNLAILASTEKTNLILRHIKSNNEPLLDIPSVMACHLHMQQNSNNVIISRSSPYHPLNGVMCVFSEPKGRFKTSYELSLHTRSPSQIISFIHYVHDAVPYKIVITTTNYRIIAKIKEYVHYNEQLSHTPSKLDFTDYAYGMINQTTMLKNHLDTCMVRMNESNNPEIQGKLGAEIDLYAAGMPAYLALRNEMINEECRGVRHLNNSCLQSESFDC